MALGAQVFSEGLPRTLIEEKVKEASVRGTARFLSHSPKEKGHYEAD